MKINRPIVDFYSGKARDSSGRSLREILAWDYRELENVHDYIQWLFPLPEPSQFNLHAPVLDAEQIAEFQANVELRTRLLASFDKMLGFYGFERHKLSIMRSDLWGERSRNWLRLGNHNHLRLTRILRSLSILGLKDYAQALFEALIAVSAENTDVISDTTLGYWKRALE